MTLALVSDDLWSQSYPAYVPSLPSTVLSEEERDLVNRLQIKSWRDRENMLLRELYYRGEQTIASLGIMLPPELEGLRIVLGWPRFAVDPYVERIWLDCFRLSTSNEPDETLGDVWVGNNMDSELSLAVLDALVKGRSWFVLASGDDPRNDMPKIGAESPFNMTVAWDTKAMPAYALQSYWVNGLRHAVLYKQDESVFLSEDENHVWQVVDRDVHRFGRLPIVRMANRPETANRDGSSEITNELMTIVDSGSRTLLNLTAAGEFYSVPQKLILGATETSFQNPDGTTKSAWSTYVSRVLALERDDAGQLPEIKQFSSYDPSVFTRVIEMYAGQAAGICAALPQDMGLYTQGNPVSAEALQTAEARRDRRARRMIANMTPAVVEVGRMAMMFLNGGDLPAGYEKLSADWQDPQMLNFTGLADGMTKLANAGIVPAGSDVVRKKLGFTAVQRRQMNREDNAAAEIIRQIGSSVEAKDIRSANALANIAAQTGQVPPSAPPATPLSGQ